MTEKQTHDRPVLLVDDETSWLLTLELMLARKAGIHNVTGISDSRKVMETLASDEYSLVLLDYTMPNLSAAELLPMITNDYPDLPVIVLTGRDQVETAVECMRKGAIDYFIKSHEEDRLVAAIRRVLAWQQQRRETERLKQGLLGGELDHPESFDEIIHAGAQMASLCHYVEAIAEGRGPVLIEGEAGAGKELFAQALHRVSGAEGQWHSASLDGMEGDGLARLLFGRDLGQPGLLEKGERGTLYLKDVEALSDADQLLLLRILQERRFFPAQSEKARKVTARLVFGTRIDLAEQVKSGKFRRDLYHRLQTHRMRVPPLRERSEDIPALLDHFLALAADTLGKKKPTPPPELVVLLQSYHFPGNVLELSNMVYEAVERHASRKLSMESFRQAMGRNEPASEAVEIPEKELVQFSERLPTLRQVIRLLVLEAMERAQGNQTVMAEMLGISRPALNKRLKVLREEGYL